MLTMKAYSLPAVCFYIMPINTEQWHAGIGAFCGRIFFSTAKRA